MNAPVRAEALTWGYPDRRPLGKGLELELRPGEAAALVGPNGAGKSTLLRTLAGLLPPLEGRVLLGGAPGARLASRDRARRVALLTDEVVEEEELLVHELVELGRTPHLQLWGLRRAADREAVEQALELCALTGLRDRALGELSAGERQRARIAMAVAQRAPLLLLDEPASHLDLRRRYELFEQLRRLRQERQVALVLVLHELPDAFREADRVLLLDGEAAVEVSSTDPGTVPRLARVFQVPEARIRL